MEELKGGIDGGALRAEGRNYHISGCSGVAPFWYVYKNTAVSPQQPVGFSFGTIES